MDNNRMKFGYEDTDKKIEIDLYGLVFEIKLDSKKIEELTNIKDEINLDEMNKYIDEILGENAVNKINEKRKNDGYKEIDENIALQILMCVFQAYSDSYIGNITNHIDKSNEMIENKYNRLNKNMNRYKNINKRRNYNYRRY